MSQKTARQMPMIDWLDWGRNNCWTNYLKTNYLKTNDVTWHLSFQYYHLSFESSKHKTCIFWSILFLLFFVTQCYVFENKSFPQKIIWASPKLCKTRLKHWNLIQKASIQIIIKMFLTKPLINKMSQKHQGSSIW